MAIINIRPLGIGLGGLLIIFGIIWMVMKNKLRYGFCKNWTDKAFYVWGITGIMAGIVLILNVKLLVYVFVISAAIFYGQSYYYNKKAKTEPI